VAHYAFLPPPFTAPDFVPAFLALRNSASTKFTHCWRCAFLRLTQHTAPPYLHCGTLVQHRCLLRGCGHPPLRFSVYTAPVICACTILLAPRRAVAATRHRTTAALQHRARLTTCHLPLPPAYGSAAPPRTATCAILYPLRTCKPIPSYLIPHALLLPLHTRYMQFAHTAICRDHRVRPRVAHNAACHTTPFSRTWHGYRTLPVLHHHAVRVDSSHPHAPSLTRRTRSVPATTFTDTATVPTYPFYRVPTHRCAATAPFAYNLLQLHL